MATPSVYIQRDFEPIHACSLARYSLALTIEDTLIGSGMEKGMHLSLRYQGYWLILHVEVLCQPCRGLSPTYILASVVFIRGTGF